MKTQEKLFQDDDSSEFDRLVWEKRDMILTDPAMMVQALKDAEAFELFSDDCIGQAVIDFVSGYPNRLLSIVAGVVEWYGVMLTDADLDYSRENGLPCITEEA